MKVLVRNTGVKCYWTVDNSLEVLGKLKKLSSTTAASHFDSFVFSTLYTTRYFAKRMFR